MNCKFCKNFIPEGSDSCPVCGRRPNEEAMSTLLSEGGMAVPAQQSQTVYKPEYAAPKKEKKTKKAKKHRKGIFAPLLEIAVGVGGWFYAVSYDLIDTLKTIYNGAYGQTAQTGADSDFEIVAGGSAFSFLGIDISQERLTLIITAIVVLLVAAISVVGVFTLFKRLYNRIKYKDE